MIIGPTIHVKYRDELVEIPRSNFIALARHGFITWLHQSIPPHINEPDWVKPCSFTNPSSNFQRAPSDSVMNGVSCELLKSESPPRNPPTKSCKPSLNQLQFGEKRE